MLQQSVVLVLLVVLSGSGLGQPLNNTTDDIDCSSNEDCPSGKACVNNRCKDPCLNACGLNTVCHVVNLLPMCSCKTGYNGHPFTGCNPGLKPQCTTNAHCTTDKACLNQQCVDPCVEVCGVNTDCRVIDHYPLCSCSRGFVWNPLSGCQPNIIPECITNTQCTADYACVNQKCVDPCSGVCGNNTACLVTDHYPACACKPGYTGDPFQHCQPQCSKTPVDATNNTGRSSRFPTPLRKKKFYPSSKEVTWQEAISECRVRNMDFATIESQEEQDDIEEIVKNTGIDKEFWVSGTQMWANENLFWVSTGKALSYSHWMSGEPSGSTQHCITLLASSSGNAFMWMKGTCSYKRFFLCEYYTS